MRGNRCTRDARPHPEERACEMVPPTRTRVRASRRMRTAAVWPSCFETQRSALRPWKHLCSLCAALLLSMRAGEGGAFWRNGPNARFGERTHAEAARLIRAKDQPVGVKRWPTRSPCFPACSLQGAAQLERVYGNRAHKLPAGAAQTHPVAAAVAGRAVAAGARESSVIKARLMVAWRVADVIFAPKRSVT